MMIAADARSNSLLVRTDNQGKLETLRTMVAQLDTPAAGMTNLQVVHLRNADAVKLAETLRQLASSEARAAALTGSAGGATTSVSTGGSNGVTILADAATNSLVINAPDHLYNSLRAVIDKLDAQRAQIFVEALIVEVTSDKAAELGVQWMAPIDIGGGDAVVLGSILSGVNPVSLATDPTVIGRGLNLGLVREFSWNGKNYTSLSMLARALQSDTEANVLSTPNLLTLDNEEAKIVIGQNVPFITGSYAQSAATGASSVNPFQTIERKDVGITLKVKPLIVEGGMIKMNIMQEASSVQKKANASEVGASDLITNKRTIETTVMVEDGKAVVLGGLIQDDVQTSNDKVPGLGDLPLIGGLFRSESRARVKTNLMVFLRPVIVNTPETMANLTQSRYDYMRGVHGAFSVPKRALLPDNSPGALPDLKIDSMLVAKTPPIQSAPDAGSKPKPAAIESPTDARSIETPGKGWFE